MDDLHSIWLSSPIIHCFSVQEQREPFYWCNQAKTVEINWRSETSLNEACKNIDAVVHLAGMNAQDCKANPATALEVNCVYGKTVEAAVKRGVKRFIHLSTAHVYAAPLEGDIEKRHV